MRHPDNHIIYTIGHSTHSFAAFLEMLQSFDIRVLADIRRFPGSHKYPQFNKDVLGPALEKNGIYYTHLEALGGRRKVRADSPNNRWKNASFRGYADYMETKEFVTAVAKLEAIALQQTTAYMCSEAVWWRCHRSMVSDYLKAKGWTVLHIMGVGKATEHTFTAPARVEGDCVFYSDSGLFDQ
ncbi:MAG: DUF488 domain-containing protein [Niabella sp.]|nr:DUF488 domain-containing protein [Niabella sp.]